MNKQNRLIIIVLITGLFLGFILSKAIDVKVSMHPKIKHILKRMVRMPIKVGAAKKDTLELCRFENNTDFKKVEKSDVQASLSQDNVKQGKYSLKCIFPDGGGGIGFYETLPKDWAEYSTLQFDVYSEESDIPLSLFIADTNNKLYYDRYNKENISLKKGWNLIEIPIKDVDKKLIIERINHLVIFLWKVKGEHVLFFDNLRLTSANKNREATTSGPIRVTINPFVKKGSISRLLYGTNLCAKMETDRDIWNFIKDRGITCFRFPGGGSPGWHWKTGTADFNAKMVNMPLSNMDYLIKFCQKVDTQIIMQVNMESGTPEEAAELVEYMNKIRNFRIDYWELGNEVYGDWDKAYTTPEKYAELIKRYSIAMKAKDPTIKIGADWGEKYYDKVFWDRTIMRLAGDYIDFISVHWYPNHTNKKHAIGGKIHPTSEELIANSMEIPNIVTRVHKIVEKESPDRKGKIEVTFLEWDGSWDAPSNDPTPPYTQGAALWSLANAIFYADSLGQFAENGITVAAHYNLQECMFGLIRGWDPAEGGGGIKWDKETIRPKAFAIELFSKHFGDILIESKVEDSPCYYKSEDWWASSYTGKVPYVTCYASVFSNNKKLGIIFINKHATQDFSLDISIDGDAKVNNLAHLWVLTGPKLISQNDGSPNTVKIVQLPTIEINNHFKYELPARSVVAMEINL